MTKDIPEINDLLQGINDSDEMLEKTIPPGTVAVPEEDSKTPEVPDNSDNGKCWDSFLTHLDKTPDNAEREDRLVCKIDRDLADSLDDCDIGNRCRSDLVNAIVRAFFETYITRLLKYRREKKSLFRKFKTE